MRRFLGLAALMLSFVVVPSAAWSCACGCGVFEVQTGGMLPTRPGGLAFLEYDLADQDKNWSGASRAPAEGNADKQIRSAFVTAGARYMLDRRWGVQAEIPYWSRRMAMADEMGEVMTLKRSALGDVRLRGIYAGFSPDMSSGVTFGFKLPTGDFRAPGFDRDTQIGTGSTDLLLGAYRMGRVGAEGRWAWFANAQWDQPVLIAAGYRPGAEVNAAVGGYYDDWSVGGLKIAPIAQAIASQRWRDAGSAARSEDTGNRRLLLAPGLEVGAGRWRANASAGFPVYQHVRGNQLVASALYKAAVSWSF